MRVRSRGYGVRILVRRICVSGGFRDRGLGRGFFKIKKLSFGDERKFFRFY